MSLSVASRIEALAGGAERNTSIGIRKMPAEAKDTAWFLCFCSKLADAFNGKVRTDPNSPYRTLLNDDSFHIPFFNEAIRNLQTMRYVDRKTKKPMRQPPTIKNLILTLRGFKTLWITLKQLGFKNLKTKHISQDPLENFFCRIRACGTANKKITCFQFVGFFKTLVVNNMTKIHSYGANCVEDESNFVLSYKSYFGFQSRQDRIVDTQTACNLLPSHPKIIACHTDLLPEKGSVPTTTACVIN